LVVEIIDEDEGFFPAKWLELFRGPITPLFQEQGDYSIPISSRMKALEKCNITLVNQNTNLESTLFYYTNRVASSVSLFDLVVITRIVPFVVPLNSCILVHDLYQFPVLSTLVTISPW